jgi:hypothetical protein
MRKKKETFIVFEYNQMVILIRVFFTSFLALAYPWATQTSPSFRRWAGGFQLS